ncbi:hypothetical protein QCD71_14635 [Sphingomonas sp. PsM26]|nr:hypothetical protein [Sphingomonas sp. PsM26]
MSALPNRVEFLAIYGRMETLKRQAAGARIEAAKREPLWVSVTLTLGVGLAIVCFVLAGAWLG